MPEQKKYLWCVPLKNLHVAVFKKIKKNKLKIIERTGCMCVCVFACMFGIEGSIPSCSETLVQHGAFIVRKSHQTHSYIIICIQTHETQHTLDGNPERKCSDNVQRGGSGESDEKRGTTSEDMKTPKFCSASPVSTTRISLNESSF